MMKQSPTLAGDIPLGNWIDRHLPAPVRPFCRLMRLDRPIGTWLLLLPAWWSLALAGDFHPIDFLLFGIGAVVMRGAGCVFNDVVDRDFDAQVARTRVRPIPSGAVTVREAVIFLAVLLAVGLVILLQFNGPAVVVGALSMALVFPYPFMKRITYWPQAWLGLTFNWGALLGWAAATGGLAAPAYILYAAGFFWTLGYDTIYAHQDKEDDALIGVKSTALRLGDATPGWLVLFYGLALCLIAVAGAAAGEGWPFYALSLLAAGQLAWQVRHLQMDAPADCLAKFKSNRYFGLLVLAGLILGKIL